MSDSMGPSAPASFISINIFSYYNIEKLFQNKKTTLAYLILGLERLYLLRVFFSEISMRRGHTLDGYFVSFVFFFCLVKFCWQRVTYVVLFVTCRVNERLIWLWRPIAWLDKTRGLMLTKTSVVIYVRTITTKKTVWSLVRGLSFNQVDFVCWPWLVISYNVFMIDFSLSFALVKIVQNEKKWTEFC